MRRVVLQEGADQEGFRAAVRRLMADGVPPQDVAWDAGGTAGLFGEASLAQAPPLALPRPVAELLELALCHRDPERHALLYTLVWRVLHGERALLEVHSDRLVHRLDMMRKAVRRDLHKMHAFLRFRRTEAADGSEHFVAWFEPDHHILEATADFFVTRFRGVAWSILTPSGSLYWDKEALRRGPGATRADAPDADSFEEGWLGYYESIFNPARVNPTAMRAEMPKKYWRHMPEAAAIPALIHGAPARVREMIAREAALPLKRDPARAVAAMARQAPETLGALNRLIAAAPPLVPGATRAVLGEGREGAAIALVGEQPGDQEDVQGRCFIGPAGQLLDRALGEAGIDRGSAYLTNAVKHFKFEQRGKRRIHQSPTAGEVKHYRWWLMQELAFVRPRIVVALGATAALALTGAPVAVTRQRGALRLGEWDGVLTTHPSYLLRLPDEAAREQAYRDFVADLRQAAMLAA
jgi:probable DNA metabolism protein